MNRFGRSVFLGAYLLLVVCTSISGCSKSEDNAESEHLLDLGRSPPVDDGKWAGRPTMSCVAESRTICTFQKCMTSNDVRIVQRVNPATKTYQRCDSPKGGCDTLEPQVAHSGIWTTLGDPVHSATLRVTLRGDFVEYLAQNDEVYIYRGMCRS